MGKDIVHYRVGETVSIKLKDGTYLKGRISRISLKSGKMMIVPSVEIQPKKTSKL